MTQENDWPQIRNEYSIVSAMPVAIDHWWGMWKCDVSAERIGESVVFRQDFPSGDEDFDQMDFSRLKKISKPLGPRQLREDFLSMRTESEVMEFLRCCGRFRTDVFQTSMRDIPEWQNFYRMWMLESSMPDGPTHPQHFHPGLDASSVEEDRLGGVLHWEVSDNFRESRQVSAVIHCHGALEVVAATIVLDLLSQAKFSACLWCKAIFEITKDNGRQFCTQDCAHRAGQKRRRTAARKLKESQENSRQAAAGRKGKD